MTRAITSIETQGLAGGRGSERPGTSSSMAPRRLAKATGRGALLPPVSAATRSLASSGPRLIQTRWARVSVRRMAADLAQHGLRQFARGQDAAEEEERPRLPLAGHGLGGP